MVFVPLVALLALSTPGPAPALVRPLAATVSVDGGTIAYDVAGRGRAVVLLHGGVEHAVIVGHSLGARIALIKGAAHMVNMEKPEEFN